MDRGKSTNLTQLSVVTGQSLFDQVPRLRPHILVQAAVVNNELVVGKQAVQATEVAQVNIITSNGWLFLYRS